VVLKCIAVREGLKQRLHDALCLGMDSMLRPDVREVMDLVNTLRSASVTVVEAVCLWRDSLSSDDAAQAGQGSPRDDAAGVDDAAASQAEYRYGGGNYLLQMTHDLDFTCHSTLLMNLFAGQLIHNPLMVPPESHPLADSEHGGWRRIIQALRVLVWEETRAAQEARAAAAARVRPADAAARPREPRGALVDDHLAVEALPMDAAVNGFAGQGEHPDVASARSQRARQAGHVEALRQWRLSNQQPLRPAGVEETLPSGARTPSSATASSARWDTAGRESNAATTPGITVPHWLARDPDNPLYADAKRIVDDLDFDVGLRRLPVPAMWQLVTEQTGITKDIVSSLLVSCALQLLRRP
jgi:hypothetical protein